MLSHPYPPIITLQQKQKPLQATPIVDSDVLALSQRIAHEHNPDVARMAALEFITVNLGHDPRAWPEGVRGSMLALQTECRQAWMVQRGISQAELQNAVSALGRAQTTLRYLDAIPD